MSRDDRRGLDQVKVLAPSRPPSREDNPEEPLDRPRPRARDLPAKDGELLAQDEVLECELAPENHGAHEGYDPRYGFHLRSFAHLSGWRPLVSRHWLGKWTAVLTTSPRSSPTACTSRYEARALAMESWTVGPSFRGCRSALSVSSTAVRFSTFSTTREPRTASARCSSDCFPVSHLEAVSGVTSSNSSELGGFQSQRLAHEPHSLARGLARLRQLGRSEKLEALESAAFEVRRTSGTDMPGPSRRRRGGRP